MPTAPINSYIWEPDPQISQLEYDMAAFVSRLTVSDGAPPRFELFKSIADRLLPGHFEWHEWCTKIISALCPDDGRKVNVLGLAGCSNSAKSFVVGSFAALWWAMNPQESSVTLVSTTMNMLRRRIWSEVQKVYYGLRQKQELGNFIQSRTMWQALKGDDKHAVIGQAVEEGSVQKVADNIKGVHTRRQMIVIDEGTSIPNAIFEAVKNLYSYPDEFILIVIGNPFSRLDQHGLFCEPDKGWNSVTVDSGEWLAKPFEPCGGARPLVLTFDAEKSPNLIHGRIISPHLPRKEALDAARVSSGGGNSPAYWTNFRGFWPPEGMAKTVWTETELSRFGAFDHFDFTGQNPVVIGALDPARDGGDKRILRFGRMSRNEQGVWQIESDPPINLELDTTLKDKPIAFQIAEQTKSFCEKIGCSPAAFGVDDSSESSLCDVIAQVWSPHIRRIQFQASPSNELISLEDNRPADEICRNKRAEMFLYSRSVLRSGQLRGVDRQSAREMCSLLVDDSKPLAVIQSKKEYRATHGGQSPDCADSLVLLLETARYRGFVLQALGQTKQFIETEQEQVKKADELYYEENTLPSDEIDIIDSELIL